MKENNEVSKEEKIEVEKNVIKTEKVVQSDTQNKETKEHDVKTMFEQLSGWDDDDDYLGDSPYPRWG